MLTRQTQHNHQELLSCLSDVTSLSFNLDQRRPTCFPLTGMPSALFCPTSTTSLLPRVVPVYMPYQGDQFPLALDLQAQNTVAVLLIVVGNAFNQAGEAVKFGGR